MRPGQLFATCVAEERLSSDFRIVRDEPAKEAARQMAEELYERLGDRDGNFREQFQTTGFDARTFELCLFAYLEQIGFELDRRHATPDFVVAHGEVRVAIEATTANLAVSDDPAAFDPEEPDQILKFMQHQLPIKLGSPLFSKLQRRYWELPQVSGAPLIFAVENFAGERSLDFSPTSLASYLYGRWSDYARNDDGSLRVYETELGQHTAGSKTIPSGFFDQPETEHVSAVLFSNSGTIGKLSRMGLQKGYGRDKIARMIRVGVRYDHDPNASEPLPFRYEVGSRTESWGEGMTMMHNPRALHPVEEDWFPDLAHMFGDEPLIYAHIPPFHPFASQTITVVDPAGS
jgi:hypothetical protein